MKTVLIVEDEKMIRQGIVAMIKRSEVEIKEVLDCKNGVEAMEILEAKHVDAVFTDIRMPKMDGITLLNRMQELPYSPHVIVISGYEDFNYAVEAMKTGVEDYILKPIDREKLSQTLVSLETAFQKEHEDKDKKKDILKQQLKYLLLNKEMNEQELELIQEEFQTISLLKEYVICCGSIIESAILKNETAIELQNIESQTVIVADNKSFKETLETIKSELCLGISRTHCNIVELKTAYEEAKTARLEAFIKGRNVVFNKEEAEETYQNKIPDNFPDQFVQCIGCDRFEHDLEKLEIYLFYAQHRKMASYEWVNKVENILKQLFQTYGQLIEMNGVEYKRLIHPLQSICAEKYMEDLKIWLYQVRKKIAEEFDDDYKKERINEAIRFIEENYSNNLNMAVVSNHISMNYSLFSISFKQYTGINFVNYLKNIRIKEAKRLLETSDEKIIEISKKVGFDNEKHFMKIFKSLCGVSPSDYRKNIQIGKNKNSR